MADHWQEYFARLREKDLAELRWHWGGAYEFTWADNAYRAVRCDTGHALTCDSASGLWGLVTADYEANPVPREPAPDTKPDKGPEEYPQAIADDYPGWGIRHQNGRWTAWCPAIALHAATATGLRAAIERAISGED